MAVARPLFGSEDGTAQLEDLHAFGICDCYFVKGVKVPDPAYLWSGSGTSVWISLGRRPGRSVGISAAAVSVAL